MDYQEFIERITGGIGEFMGEGTEVFVNKVVKNNSVCLDGLCILEKNSNISPTIYLNGYYEDYRRGRPMGAIIADIAALFDRGKLSGNVNVDFFTDYEKVKYSLVYKLINYEKNRELLKEIPHRRYLDLAIVYCCLVMNDTLGNATILVYNSHVRMWGISVWELHGRAEENTRRLLGYECKSMEEVMRELFMEEMKNERMEEQDEAAAQKEEAVMEEMLSSLGDFGAHAPMYVMSNRARINGAACILYPDVLKDFSEKLGHDLYILPSSIHEIIALPAIKGESPAFLGEMVREVNETQVEEEEILSDLVYYYDRTKRELHSLNM